MKSMDAIDEKVRASAVKLKRAFAGSAPGHVRARAALTGARIAAAVGSKGSIAILGSRDNDSLLSFLQKRCSAPPRMRMTRFAKRHASRWAHSQRHWRAPPRSSPTQMYRPAAYFSHPW